MNKIIVSFTAFFLISCAAKVAPIRSEFSTDKNYQVNETKSCNVGEAIFSAIKGKKRDAYAAIDSLKTPAVTPKFNLNAVQPVYLGDIKTSDIFYVLSETPTSVIIAREDSPNIGIDITKNGEISKGFVQFISSTNVQYLGQTGWPKGQLFKKLDKGAFVKNGSFKTELIYGGLNGNNISVAYREFTENLIRPAFSQELTYNLDKEKVISYKGVKIEVIKATNSQLTYKIVDDGNLAWMPGLQ